MDYSGNITEVYRMNYPSLYDVALSGNQLYSLNYQPRTFAIGLYRFSLTVTVPPASTDAFIEAEVLSGDSVTYISIVASKLTACVNNGASVVGGVWDAKNAVTLNAGCSSDPDRWPSEPQGLTFSWLCFRGCETAPKFTADDDFIPWNTASNPYNSTCQRPSNMAGSTGVSSQGCFMPLGVHISGPILRRNLMDWSSSNPLNPLKVHPEETGNKVYLDLQYWVYTIGNDDNSQLQLQSGAMFFRTEHYFIAVVQSRDGVSFFLFMVTYVLCDELCLYERDTGLVLRFSTLLL